MKRLILASQSAARKKMLEGAGLHFEIVPAHLDEAAITRDQWEQGDSPAQIALVLAQAKAVEVSKLHPDALVIGSDQVLGLGKRMLDKATGREDALEKLEDMKGRTHRLHAAACVARDGGSLWSQGDHADLTMRNLSREQLENYADSAGGVLTSCVGSYALEGQGAWLFKKIEGDYFTILGMPLLPLLDYLSEQGYGP
jgi:septum formation protein